MSTEGGMTSVTSSRALCTGGPLAQVESAPNEPVIVHLYASRSNTLDGHDGRRAGSTERRGKGLTRILLS